MSVYDLYQSYLNQISDVNQNQTPGITDPNYLLYLQQQQGQGGGAGDDRFTNVVDPSKANAGITSISDAYSRMSDYFSPYGMVGGLLGGIPGAFAGRAIGNLIGNIQNPNTTMFGQPTQAYQTQLENIAKQKRDIQQYTGGGGGGQGPSGPATTSQGVTSAQHAAFRN
jgi:hypothetical protein